MDSYINGSDLLVNVGGGAVGHSTTCTITFNSETKERAVKPLASLPKSAGLWKEKGITGLSISIKADGLRVYEERATLSRLQSTGVATTPTPSSRVSSLSPRLR